MNEKRDFSEIERRIREAISEAVETGDFSGIGQAVSETAEDAADQVRRQVNRVQESLNQNRGRTPEWNAAPGPLDAALSQTGFRKRRTGRPGDEAQSGKIPEPER